MSCALFVLIVASYTMSLLMHLFCNGLACLFLQLQLPALMPCGWLFLIMRIYIYVGQSGNWLSQSGRYKKFVEDKFQIFISELKKGIDCYLPQRTVKVHQTDRPWMTNKLKIWIRKRQTAFQRNGKDSSKHKYWRNN